MSRIEVEALNDDLPFGARVRGVTFETLKDEAVRQQLRDVFEDRGLIVFAGIEASSLMHVTLSDVFGPLKDHPVPSVDRVDQDAMPGVIDMIHNPDDAGIVEVDGRTLSSWIPWHYDHCYNNELNRAGVLRAVTVAPEGGETHFADGVQLYRALSPELRSRIEGSNIIYTLNTAYETMRFGRPENLRNIRKRPGQDAVAAQAKLMPRAIHPAVWTRASGEKVLHVSPWMSEGIEGAENAEGEALFEDVCQEINRLASAGAYRHRWSTDEMLIWDNWRVLHSVSGVDPKHPRRMQRTTIRGDYGLGYFEGGGVGGAVLEMTV